MPNADENQRDFGVGIAVFGAALATGLYAFVEHQWWFGAFYTAGGGLGLLWMSPAAKAYLWSQPSRRVLLAVAVVTWFFLSANVGSSIYSRYIKPTEANSAPDIEAAVAPVRAELERANKEKIALQQQIDRLSDPNNPVFTNAPSLNRKLTHDEATALIGLIDKLDIELKDMRQIPYDPSLPWVKPRRWGRPLPIGEQISDAAQLRQALNKTYDNIQTDLKDGEQFRAEFNNLLSVDADQSSSLNPLKDAIDSLEHYREDSINITRTQPNGATSQELVECKMNSTVDLVGNKLQFLFRWSDQVRQRIPQLKDQASKFL